ncbi:neugrin [Aulostomus maculatus]
MARPLRVVSLLYRACSRSLFPSVSGHSCRFASRDSMYNSDEPEEDFELEDLEDRLQAVVDMERKKRKTLKYHKMKRKMTPSGAPDRKLTWEAIDQIRYLKQEQPYEWTVERLAEGFSVTPDVIQRVLRSKFVPAPGRKTKQDAKVMAAHYQQGLPSGATEPGRPKLPGDRSSTALPPGSREVGLVPVADRTLNPGSISSGSLAKMSPPVSVQPHQVTAGVRKGAKVTIRPSEEDVRTSNTIPEEDGEYEESWDGNTLTEEKLEKFIDMKKPPPVVQVGNEFFDADGVFLFKI